MGAQGVDKGRVIFWEGIEGIGVFWLKVVG